MTPEERSLLEKTHKLAEENNDILRGMRRTSRFSLLMRVIYWVVILALTLGAYYFIQPYLKTVLDLYDQVQEGIKGIKGDVNSVQNTANSLRDLLK